MAACSIANVKVVDGKDRCRVDEDFVFEVTLDVAEPLKEDLVFQCVYITHGSGDEVELESIDVGDGPGLRQGFLKFNFESAPPSKEDREALFGILADGFHVLVAGLYLSASYGGKEFCRVGYYVRYEYDDPELQENPPEMVDWNRVHRVLSAPRVTKFVIPWDAMEELENADAKQYIDPFVRTCWT
ncbi:unnamed protein product [Durusdinium trenchii]|uniref:Uncharacterized protein n=1 Tax=Durusdinium trenchii TaxID=1381693 RepID=A0ABP0KFP3_9DINO